MAYTSMAKGTITISNPVHIKRGCVLMTSTSTGEQKFYVIGQKSETELYVAASWRDSLWVPWIIVTGWLVQRWQAFRLRVEHAVWRWNKLYSSDRHRIENDSAVTFVAEADDSADVLSGAKDSDPDIGVDPRGGKRTWH
jgi:hypothetical protein